MSATPLRNDGDGDIKRWVAGILGAIDGQTPPKAAQAIVYAVTAALNAAADTEILRSILRTVASQLEVKTLDLAEIQSAIDRLKNRASKAHQDMVLKTWTKQWARRKKR